MRITQQRVEKDQVNAQLDRNGRGSEFDPMGLRMESIVDVKIGRKLRFRPPNTSARWSGFSVPFRRAAFACVLTLLSTTTTTTSGRMGGPRRNLLSSLVAAVLREDHSQTSVGRPFNGLTVYSVAVHANVQSSRSFHPSFPPWSSFPPLYFGLISSR